MTKENFKTKKETYGIVTAFSMTTVWITLVFLFLAAGQQPPETAIKYLVAAGTFLLMITGPFLYMFGGIMRRVEGVTKNILKFYISKNATELGAVGFFFGMVVWTITVSSETLAKFVAYDPGFSVFSDVAGIIEAPFWSNYIITVAAPFAEEMFFVGIAFFAVTFFNMVAKSTNLKFFGDKIVQFMIIIPTISWGFAFFHIGQQADPTFFTVSMVFRAILLFVVFFETGVSNIPYAPIGYNFLVGVHVANNIIATGGYEVFLNAMLSEPFGLLFLGGFALIFYTAVYTLFYNRKIVWEKV